MKNKVDSMSKIGGYASYNVGFQKNIYLCYKLRYIRAMHLLMKKNGDLCFLQTCQN